MSKARFSVQPQREDTPSDAHRWLRGFESGCVRRRVFFDQFLGSCRPIKPVRISFVAPRLDFGKLFLALKELVNRIKR